MINFEFEQKSVSTNGIRLNVIQAGPDKGPLVILLHGFPEFWYGWRHQIPFLSEAGYRVWVPDQRGYNLSDKPQRIRAYHIDTLAKDIIGLIDAAGEEDALVVGHDWGAAVAWHITTYYPARVRNLVIMNVPRLEVMIRNLRENPSQRRRSNYIFYFQLPFIPERKLARNNYKVLVDTLRKTSKPGSFSDEDIILYQKAWSQPGALTGMLNWYRNVARSNLRHFLSPPSPQRIKTPTLLIWGTRDRALGKEMAQPSIDLCEEGQLVQFEEATHWVQHDEAEQVNELLLDFLVSG